MSTYPPNLRRASNDRLDISFLAKLVDENGSKISFQLYHAQYPEILDQAVKDAVTYLQTNGLVAQSVAQSVLLINIIAPSERAVRHIKDKTLYVLYASLFLCLFKR